VPSLPCGVATADERRRARARLLEARRTMAPARRLAADAAISDRLAALVAAHAAAIDRCVIAAYWPMQGEPDVRALFGRWIAEGATTVLPVVESRGAPLRFAPYAPGDPLVAGAHGTVEPETADRLEPDIVVVPCVGFSVDGWRLGYGGGYYDRTLARRGLLAVVVAYDESELPGLRPQPHDVALSFIVTQRRSIACRPTAGPEPADRPAPAD
jgi:5,10-methenyltetrahydrofolate synthetase